MNMTTQTTRCTRCTTVCILWTQDSQRRKALVTCSGVCRKSRLIKSRLMGALMPRVPSQSLTTGLETSWIHWVQVKGLLIMPTQQTQRAWQTLSSTTTPNRMKAETTPSLWWNTSAVWMAWQPPHRAHSLWYRSKRLRMTPPIVALTVLATGRFLLKTSKAIAQCR